MQKLLDRIHAELAADFTSDKPLRITHAPASLDVFGGVAEMTGSLIVSAALNCGATVVSQPRPNRQIQIFSFNLFDQHQPFTFRIPLDAFIKFPLEKLREEFNAPGRRWAGHAVACLHALSEKKPIDLTNPNLKGLNLAIHNTAPSGVGIGSTAAMESAAMMNFVAHLNPDGVAHEVSGHFTRTSAEPKMMLAMLCHQARKDVLGLPGGITAYATSFCGQSGELLRLRCQPHELQPPLVLPNGIRVLGINSGVIRADRAERFEQLQSATTAAHQMILSKMQQMAANAGKPLQHDPLNGYLANLDPDDYKVLSRPSLPESLQHAADHHVLETRRVRRFCEFLAAAACADGPKRKSLLDKAGHLMYASHLSYSNDAMLGDEHCDLLVELIRQRERQGFYGARITATGCGGTVAVLADEGERADAALADIIQIYHRQTGKNAEVIPSTNG